MIDGLKRLGGNVRKGSSDDKFGNRKVHEITRYHSYAFYYARKMI
jgi:hypothetical protein